MVCRFSDLRKREVVNIKDGTKYGFVGDLLTDTKSACVTALVICGRPRFFGLFGREDDFVVRWDEIHMIGDDIILVDCKTAVQRQKRKKLLEQSFCGHVKKCEKT